MYFAKGDQKYKLPSYKTQHKPGRNLRTEAQEITTINCTKEV